MDKPLKKILRCAIYTRKSTDHNLDLEFNSLDAQREACEAYIKSQAHEGWRLIPDSFDDGAFSGASLDRPALQELLTEVGSGKIDIIVVYKVDRLTRSLADFAKLVELFDQHSVSFVSVTQSFNTTTSMGRLTLNVLLSFAQFEREVIGERVRDKIAASKAKGIWVGGSVPLGYKSVDKKLVVLPEEAETVRLIFRRYLEVGSIRALVEDLDSKGIRTRKQTLSTGRTRGGIPFGVGSVTHLLRNRFVIGEVDYRGAIHTGEHEPIVDRALFETVQAKLAANANVRQLKLKASTSILTGCIFDDRGNRMTPTHTNKRGARYRYYASSAKPITRVPAHEIETLVSKALREHSDNTAKGDRELIEQEVDRIVVKPEAIEICLKCAEWRESEGQDAPEASPPLHTIPWSSPPFTETKGIQHSPSSTMSPASRDMLLAAIAKARAWVDDLVEGRVASFAEIAKQEGKVERHVRFLAPLAFVSPRIVAAIAEGTADLKVTELAKVAAVNLWTKQEQGLICGPNPEPFAARRALGESETPEPVTKLLRV